MASVMRIITKSKSCLGFPSLLLFSFSSILLAHGVATKDTLKQGEVLRDSDTLVSSNGVFQLGFFNPDSTPYHYLGIWIKRYSSGGFGNVWVAITQPSIPDSTGNLSISLDGNLVIMHNGGTSFILSSHDEPLSTNSSSSNTSATLLNSGNLVLRTNGETIVWQSFDHPSDMYLPGMKLGLFDLKTAHPRIVKLISWLSPKVLQQGAFTLGINPNNTKELVILQRDVVYWRGVDWNGRFFNSSFNFSYVSNENESYFTFTSTLIITNLSDYITGGFFLDSTGGIVELNFYESKTAFGKVMDCTAMENFTPWSSGCQRLKPSKCRDGDVFSKIMGSAVNFTFVSNDSMGFSDCKAKCRENCSCVAFSNPNSYGIGCAVYYRMKEDIPNFQGAGGDIIYIRTDGVTNQTNKLNSTLPYPNNLANHKKRKVWLIIMGSVVAATVLILGFLCCIGRRTRSQDGRTRIHKLLFPQLHTNRATNDLSRKEDHDLPLFTFYSIVKATDNFSVENKLGEGGFGPVYKGKLLEGQEVAIKRLSIKSKQGSVEFKNEVKLLSKLQHKNLVKILGCCIQGEEKILIYEFMPNKSLDTFLFDSTKRASLDWRKRVCIIEGIAQGLLYLHKYSRLKIIHRDLKISNILLDSDMNPKISDFGTARIFDENESQERTNRIIGTYGYMSPEYAMDGLFSVKSDVFSFGVMTLEIVSGKKNIGFYLDDRSLNLLGYMWELWKDGKDFELMDPALDDSCPKNEVMRYIHVGLLCVQESATDRPTMSHVVYMLSHETTTLPPPKQPAFSTKRSIMVDSNSLEQPYSINDLTLSKVDAR